MSTFETQPRNFPDDQMETLLRDFFAGEMPVEISELDDRPLTRRATEPACIEQPAARRMTTHMVRWLGSAVAVAGMLLLAWNIVPNDRPGRDLNQVAGRSVSQESAAAPAERTLSQRGSKTQAVAADNTSRPATFSFPPRYLVTENVAALGLRKYATLLGPVEQRTRVRTTSFSYYEPTSGSQVRVNVPEIEIEILAAKDEGT